MSIPEPVIAFTREWWLTAVEDVEAARVSRHLPTACCFHCRQAVEKALKTLLVLHQTEFEKSRYRPTSGSPSPHTRVSAQGDCRRFGRTQPFRGRDAIPAGYRNPRRSLRRTRKGGAISALGPARTAEGSMTAK